MRKFVMVVVALMTLLGTAGAAGAHPLSTFGTERSIAGTSEGHTHGLECAARVSDPIDVLGLPCASDGRR